MPLIDGVCKTRRPIGHKVEPDGPEPETGVRTFLYREDAAEAAKGLVGWDARVQYLGVWMRWVVVARRKSWSSAREVFLHKDGTLTPWSAS
jgi:hypothetical protein